MKALKVLAATLIWVVASVLLLLAVVLSVTVVLLPVGALLGYLAMRLYRWGFRLLLPGPRTIKRQVRKRVRRLVNGLRR